MRLGGFRSPANPGLVNPSDSGQCSPREQFGMAFAGAGIVAGKFDEKFPVPCGSRSRGHEAG